MGDLDLAMAFKRLSLAFIPLAVGIIIHEVAHGWVAWRKGDMTAKFMGRITLNPIAHVDATGLFAFVFTSLFAPFVFGWAKPVPVNYRHLKNPLKDMVLIAAAGPLSNFALAFLFALATRAFLWLFPPLEWQGNTVWLFFVQMLPMGVGINCSLAWLNLMPVPPLDGSKIITGILPYKWLGPYLSLERYGMAILILLLATGMLGKVLYPLISNSYTFFLSLVGLV